MDTQKLSSQIEKNSADIESMRKAMGVLIDLLERVSSAVDEGFTKVNERLSILEGKEGMQGVNMHLGEIKQVLH